MTIDGMYKLIETLEKMNSNLERVASAPRDAHGICRRGWRNDRTARL